MTTKEKVLNELKNAQGNAVSGEQIAQICGVSRAAIWKAINSLRQEGWEIQGTTNGGYILGIDNDVFSQNEFEGYFNEKYPELVSNHQNLYIECFKEIDSTNTYAKKLLSERNDVKTGIIVAESQTAGRGRLGRTFYSPSNTGIYLSVIYSPENGVTQPAKLTASSAVAVCRAIRNVFGTESSIKWINDIFIDGKKVCGILTEGFTNFETGMIESAIIGIGVNIKDNPQAMPEDVKKVAGSILGEAAEKSESRITEGSRCVLAAEISAQVLKVLEEEPSKVMEEYRAASFLIGTEVQVFPVAGGEESYKATVVDIDENAGLVVRLDDGSTKVLSSGEVTLHSGSLTN